MTTEDVLDIYTDGSCYPKPRRGGIGIRLVYPATNGEEFIDDQEFEGYKGANSVQMELEACILALKKARECEALSRLARIVVHSDSQFVVNNCNNALFLWPRTKWLTRQGNPVSNVELWKELVKQIKKSPKKVEFVWVRGDGKNIHNRAVDKLAKRSANGLTRQRISFVDVRRKQSPSMVKINSVERKGQRILIRIISGEDTHVRGYFKYKYEVMSSQSGYYQRVDFGFSREVLRSGHIYLVSLNKKQTNSIISRVIREVVEPKMTSDIQQEFSHG